MGSRMGFRDGGIEDPGDSATFTVCGFYGGTRSNSNVMEGRIAQVTNTIRQMEARPIPSNYNPGILGPPSTWKVFPKQAEAIKYSQLRGGCGLMVFSYENETLSGTGCRSYLVAHPRLMWLRLMERKPRDRCSYEVVQENSVCKLYFDLEFSVLHNPDRDGNAMVNTFICIICYYLQKVFGICCARRNIIDLASFTFLKFSRHLIFNLSKVAFATNIHVGNFVRLVCNKIREWNSGADIEIPGLTTDNIKNLFVMDKDKKLGLFCDEGVYTKNRNFRVLHATKRGKNAPLIIAKENEYDIVPKTEISFDEQFFIDSLLTTVNENCKVLTFGDTIPKNHTPAGFSKGESTVLGTDFSSKSPYPEIDDHILLRVQPGCIRSWYYFSQGETLVYEIAKNRYCHNIGREHKSNGVLYVVNLKTGIIYQKCHDPNCRDFRSTPWHLPESTMFWKNLKEDDVMEVVHSGTDFSDEDDELLVTAAKQAESEIAISDDELRTKAENLEMWDNIDALSSCSRGNSLQGSQASSLSLSQASNPWDKLSQLSTPDSPCFASFSEMALSVDESHKVENKTGIKRKYCSGSGSESANILENDSDEELVKEAVRVEREAVSQDSNTNNSEVEFNSYEL